jgi:hypothetical protein
MSSDCIVEPTTYVWYNSTVTFGIHNTHKCQKNGITGLEKNRAYKCYHYCIRLQKAKCGSDIEHKKFQTMFL